MEADILGENIGEALLETKEGARHGKANTYEEGEAKLFIENYFYSRKVSLQMCGIPYGCKLKEN